MANMFCVSKSERSVLRRLPILPRFGITVDIAGRQFTYKHAPLLETLLNVKDRGFSLKNLLKVANEQLAEIGIPRKSTRAPVLAVKDAPEAPTAQAGARAGVKKAAPKAAAKKKPDAV